MQQIERGNSHQQQQIEVPWHTKRMAASILDKPVSEEVDSQKCTL